MKRFEYIKLKLSNFPEYFVERYNLEPKADKNGQVYVNIRRGMYGLPQVGLLAQQLLEERLNAKGYSHSTLVLASVPTSGDPSLSPFV